jgi:hypothetical protein
MAYTVKEVVGLPVIEEREVAPGVMAPVPTGETVRKEPGDTITKQEMDDAGQTEEMIESLIESGAIEEK